MNVTKTRVFYGTKNESSSYDEATDTWGPEHTIKWSITAAFNEELGDGEWVVVAEGWINTTTGDRSVGNGEDGWLGGTDWRVFVSNVVCGSIECERLEF